MNRENIFEQIPEDLTEESFKDILTRSNIRIERILSKGHSSPESGWYDQDKNEWVMVIEGDGVVLFDDGREIRLSKGDYLNIPRRAKHKVKWTDPSKVTIWLAIFYN